MTRLFNNQYNFGLAIKSVLILFNVTHVLLGKQRLFLSILNRVIPEQLSCSIPYSDGFWIEIIHF